MRHVRTTLLALFLTASAATSALAQKTTGDITGTVTDSTGAVLPGVTVTAVCPATNFTRTVVTDAQGGYSMPELPVCVYKAITDLPGFKSVSRDVQVAVSSVSKADFKLEVGAQSESITVEGVTPLIEFSDKLNNYVDKARIDQIPLSGRDFNSLLGVTPGVQRAAGGGFLAVSVSGAKTTSNNYMIDGISNNDRYYGDSVLNQTGVVGVPATLVPMDAIAEFTVQQTPSAEFGVKGGAAINVVMKSGSNSVHGTGYYFRHDDWTDSPNYFVKKNGGETTPIKNQQYGGTVGGPIRTDKTFFFGYYEGQRLAVISPFQVQVPTAGQIASARARIATAGLRTNPVGENILKFFPVSPSGTLTVQAPNVANMSTFSVKIDHQLNTNNLINGRFFFGNSYQSAPAFTGELTPANGPADMFNSVTDPTRVALLGFVWNSTISAHTLLETRFGYNFISQTIGVNNNVDPNSLGLNTGPLDAADLGVPGIYLGNFGSLGGVAGYPITTAPTRNYEVSSALTHTTGPHTFKLGANFQRGDNRSVRNRARSSFTISGGTFDDVDSIVALLLGRFDNAARSFGSTERHLALNSIGGFFNEEWKANARLTLTGGLRYEAFGSLKEQDNIASNFIPGRGLLKVGSGIDELYATDRKTFGPRAGLAWDVTGDGRTGLRVGYALTYDNPQFGTVHAPGGGFSGLGSRSGSFTNPDLGVFSVSLNGATSELPDSPRATCINPNNPNAGGDFVCVQPGVSIYGSNPSGTPPFNVFAVDQNLKTPQYHYFHVSVQRELFKNNAVTASYVSSRGQQQIFYHDINGTPLGTPLNAIQQSRPFFSQFPNYKHIIQLTNDGKSFYDGLQLSYRQSNWHGINTQYNYTLSKCEDYGSSNRAGRSDFPQQNNPYDPAGNRGPCSFDVRHNFNVGGTYAIPGGGIVKGLEIGTVFTALSPRPFTPNVGSRDRSGQDTGALRAVCLADPIYNFTNPDAFITNAATAFATPANNALGTCGRNSARRPGLAQWDLNVIKTFHLSGSNRIQARWEIFNVLNRVNLGLPQSTNVRSSAFGTIGSTPDVDAGNPVIAQGGPRAMQWAVKVLF